MATPTTAELVLSIRRKLGESQEALARRLGVSFATVNAWERGRSQPRRMHRARLTELAADLGVRHGLTVLAIDDDPASCAVVEGLVVGARRDAEVLTTTNASEGLLLCGAVQPDILFLDILMPGLDGFDVARRIAHIDGLEHLQVVFMTSSRDERILERARLTGSPVLTKPLTSEDVAAAIGGSMRMAQSIPGADR